MKTITHFHVIAVSESGNTVMWQEVDSFKSSDDGETLILKDPDGVILGTIPVNRWVVSVQPRNSNKKL